MFFHLMNNIVHGTCKILRLQITKMDSRKRLRPWLLKKVEANECGLRWINREERIFSIPWSRKNNRSWNHDYCVIFKEWAIYTNRYTAGDVEDWPGWKQRLRAALTKLSNDFKEIPDMHRIGLDVDQPYRVYQFVDDLRGKSKMASSYSTSIVSYSPSSSQRIDSSPGASSRSSNSPDTASPGFDAEVYTVNNNLGASSNAANTGNVASPLHLHHHNVQVRNIIGNIPSVVTETETQSSTSACNVDGLVLAFDDVNRLPTSTQANYRNVTNIIHPQPMSIGEGNDVLNLPSDLCSLDSGDLIDKLPSSEIKDYKLDVKPGTQQCQQQSGPKPTIKYKIFYLDKLVKEDYLYNAAPAHFYFGNLPHDEFPEEIVNDILGPQALKQIALPDVTQLSCSLNAEHQKLVTEILLKMDRGFHLASHEGNIYAQRLCRTRIYGSGDCIGANVLLPREKGGKPTKIFDLKEYKDRFLESKTKPFVLLTFAQEYKIQSVGKLLVRMEVTPLEASELLPQSSSSSSLSLKSSLLLSDLNSGDMKVLKVEQQMSGLSMN